MKLRDYEIKYLKEIVIALDDGGEVVIDGEENRLEAGLIIACIEEVLADCYEEEMNAAH